MHRQTNHTTMPKAKAQATPRRVTGLLGRLQAKQTGQQEATSAVRAELKVHDQVLVHDGQSQNVHLDGGSGRVEREPNLGERNCPDHMVSRADTAPGSEPPMAAIAVHTELHAQRATQQGAPARGPRTGGLLARLSGLGGVFEPAFARQRRAREDHQRQLRELGEEVDDFPPFDLAPPTWATDQGSSTRTATSSEGQ